MDVLGSKNKARSDPGHCCALVSCVYFHDAPAARRQEKQGASAIIDFGSMVGIVQWWNAGLWHRMVWVRVPLPTPAEPLISNRSACPMVHSGCQPYWMVPVSTSATTIWFAVRRFSATPCVDTFSAVRMSKCCKSSFCIVTSTLRSRSTEQ